MIDKLLSRLRSRLERILASDKALCQRPDDEPLLPAFLSQRGMVARLLKIPNWKDKIDFYQSYEYSVSSGDWRIKCSDSRQLNEADKAASATVNTSIDCTIKRIHYGCGGNLIDGWLNVDLSEFDAPNYRRLNLVEKHPFNDGTFEFAYAEDVLEHLTQAESLFFLSEIYRTLARGGVARLSFPGLEGVLRRHYEPCSEKRVREGEFEAYAFWDHIHFYSREEIRLVGNHMGFQEIDFVEYGNSRHPELCGLDTRSDQTDLNIIVELRK